MSKDPAFLFYPGDYLRDTQCLSEAVQVAYDRIMCEHMRNICISQSQLNFFTRGLTEDEKQELQHVLAIVDGGYEISWVADSIRKRLKYSKSRSENRAGKTKKDMNNISSSYVEHMEIENENEIEHENKGGEGGNVKRDATPLSDEGLSFANWLREVFTDPELFTEKKIIQWRKMYDKFRNKGRIKDDIWKAIKWAREDQFWQPNFLSPAKLDRKNKDGILYIDVFIAAQKSAIPKTPPKPVHPPTLEINPWTGLPFPMTPEEAAFRAKQKEEQERNAG